ncbi:MAG: hypothetical protein JSW66_16775 [Phycisphaerales bacterium]|nr:MAG: hypothetical protein JSW66_16775 [Phycisphaerales bacterium]
MNLPNFKDVLQKLAVFKNNKSLLVAVILAVAGGLLLVPTHLMSRSLQARVQQESISRGAREIDRHMPNVVSKDQFEKAAAIQDAYAKDFNDVKQLAEQTTKRELLSYEIFPGVDPNAGFSALVFQVFGQRYRNGIDELITRVNARDCPTNEEIQRGLEDLSSGARSRGRFSMMDSYETMSTGGLYGGSMMMGSVQRMIVDEMCVDRAKSTFVYMNVADISGYDYWGNYVYDVKPEEAVKDCWYYQLAYWVIEDIFDTIEAMNSGHDSVLTAPVKRFQRVTFTMGLKRPRAGGGVFTGFSRQKRQGQSREDADKPTYVLSATDGLTESCTGRFSDLEGDIDVIHFNAAFVVGARDVLPFMEELCSGKEHQFRGYPEGTDAPQTFKHNQINILESKIGSPTLTDMTHRYYRYGQDNVVVLDLVCEYTFNKKGYEAIIPESVLNTLAGLDEEATR